jgi:hypothetical protein
MAAGSTYTPIQTQTLGSAVSTVTFSSIPSTYTDLILVAQTKQVSSSSYSLINFNSDTGANYSQTTLDGNGSTASSARAANSTAIYAFFNFLESTSNFTTSITQIMNYTNANTYKTVLIRSGDAGQDTKALVGLWRSASTISSIQFFSNNTLAIGSTFTLYGIAAA